MAERSGTYESTDKVATTTLELTQLVDAITQAFKQVKNQDTTPLEGAALDAAKKFAEILIRLGVAAAPKE